MKSSLKILFLIFVICLISCGNNNDSKITVNTDSLPPDIAEITQKISDDPDNPDLYNQRAILYLQRKEVEQAFNDASHAIALDQKNPAFYRTLSDVYFAQGKSTKCREMLNKALEIDPEDTEALLKLAELNFYFRDYKGCFDYINKALTIDELNPRAYFMKGMVYKEIGDTAKAVTNLQIAIEKDQEYYDAFIQLGVIYLQKKNPLAADYFNNALKIKPESIEALYGLGMFYQETAEYNKAIESYTAILKIDPKYKYAHYNLGYIHLVYLQVYDVAARHFSDAIQADPNYAEAWYNRGYCYELLGDVIKARADYQEAIRLKPNYMKAVEGMNRLDKIMSQG